jgi:hypothetical protein
LSPIVRIFFQISKPHVLILPVDVPDRVHFASLPLLLYRLSVLMFPHSRQTRTGCGALVTIVPLPIARRNAATRLPFCASVHISPGSEDILPSETRRGLPGAVPLDVNRRLLPPAVDLTPPLFYGMLAPSCKM